MKSSSSLDLLSRPRMLLTMEDALDWILEGALDAGGGDGDDSTASAWWLRLCLEREVCLDVSVCDDLALDLLE